MEGKQAIACAVVRNGLRAEKEGMRLGAAVASLQVDSELPHVKWRCYQQLGLSRPLVVSSVRN